MASAQSNVDMSLLHKEFPQFKDVDFRVDADTRKGSVLDAMALPIGVGAAKEAWCQMKQSTDPAIVELRAHEFRKTSAKYMSRLLSGDLSLIDEIEARFDNSTPEEREFFRNGTEETPDRKRRREELEDERVLRLKREATELRRMEADVRRLEMENIGLYRGLLEEFGLDTDPRMRMLLTDAVANVLVPTTGTAVRAIEGPALVDQVTVGKFLVDHGLRQSASAVGRRVSQLWRAERGADPPTTLMMVNGDMRPVKVYPVDFLRRHVVG
ncbi:hypothetical protein GHT06_003867 [Daphnia sinensis]|uniref:Uncharacterized protein n=1 Tax=Daphnia sinensis TaxID=1820382 RepID=A0AAD5KDP3_9CRUS|nr:hypothetical protein GHT06_003867 [Daphnia sinensis]